MKLLVTGGAGFIGSHFIKWTLKNRTGCTVTNLDKLTYCGNQDNLKDINKDPRYIFIKGDICNEALVDRLVRKADAIINLAAETHVDRAIENDAAFVRTNVLGTQVLLKAAVRYNVKRFLQVSTDEVYGSRKKGAFKETDPLNPGNPYSATKAAADMLVLSYARTYKLNAVISRSSNNFGPFQFPEKLIPLFITRLIEGKKVPLYGDGKNIRDWIYVLDHCFALDLLLRKGRAGEIYNIPGQRELSNIVLTKKILDQMGRPERMIRFVPDRPGHDWRYAIDGTKIRRLGFKRQIDFENALDSTIKWYEDNRSWWQTRRQV